jgi:hypothetical protein
MPDSGHAVSAEPLNLIMAAGHRQMRGAGHDSRKYASGIR